MSMHFPEPIPGTVYYPPQGPIYKAALRQIWKKKSGTASRFNKIVNPVMQVSQQNGDTAGAVNGYYMADQWALGLTLATGAVSGQRVAKVTPRGSKYRLRITVQTAQANLGATDYCWFYQLFEGNRVADFNYGSPKALYGMLRIGLNAPAGTYVLSLRGIDRSLTFDVVVLPGRANRDTEFIFVVPPSLDGSWAADNSMGLLLGLCFAAGSDRRGVVGQWQAGSYIGTTSMSNGMATAGNVFELFDVGLHTDPAQTGVAPEFQAPHIEDDLQDCLRYWYPAYRFDGVVNSPTNAYGWNSHYVPMRVPPSMALVGTLRAYDVSTAPNITSIGGYNINADSGSLLFTTTGLITGRALKVLVDGQTASYVAVNARL